ncbi:hypothetical protein AB6A40_004696 [Gnathostoma spinigerum]|uniref:Prefoldin subunit 3 n=1 Tax=Gnathostoma spinigerum TaxID=75299 RepID=A0ABD6EMQ4_9BILA
MAGGEEVISKRGIPATEVMEDVGEFLRKEGDISVEEGVKRIEESYRKYKFVEQQMVAQIERVSASLPDLKESLKILDQLEEQKKNEKPFEMLYLLSDQLFTKVRVDNPEKVHLWLGANVMVEYSLSEARAIIEKNLRQAENVIEEITKELDFVKDQITTTEVNIAHVYNYGVQQKRLESAK